MIRLICVSVLFMLLSACQSIHKPVTQVMPQSLQGLLNTSTFAVKPIESEEDIFLLSDEIKMQLDEKVRRSNRIGEASVNERLFNFIADWAESSVNYSAGSTLSANQTFFSQKANCLSLSIMAYSMAEYLNINSRFQRVFIPEYWSEKSGYKLLSGHVNVRLKAKKRNSVDVSGFYNDLIVDFNPEGMNSYKTELVDRSLITAMFYNNMGVEAMLRKEYDLAYSYYMGAIKKAPQFSSSFVNLGVLYRIHDDFYRAETVYSHAADLNDKDLAILSNLAILYDLTDRARLARLIRQKIEKKRRANPYYAIAKGDEALYRGDINAAVTHFKKAKKLDRSIHESYFGLAKAYAALGDLEKTQSELKKAKFYSLYESDKQKYDGKLRLLGLSL